MRESRELERASLLPPERQHRPSWYRQKQKFPRCLRGVSIIALLYGIAAFYRIVSDMHDQALKLHATDFSGLHQQGAELWTPTHPDRENLGQYIDDRYRYVRHLGSGKEGSVDLCVDEEIDQPVVVKQYQSTSRNFVPSPLRGQFANFTSFWPTEIEAGLRLVNYTGFVPVLDYFILHEGTRWSWALVSSFMSNGTLDTLAKTERSSRNNTLQELDTKYRPSLNTLFSELQPLHNAGLCHDDVKTDNIFIKSETDWLLGDIGNMRHFSHPWHATASWKRQNQWQNCQVNDLRRALKTYLWFLRSATADAAEFDRRFWAAEESWARMYWDFVGIVKGFEMTVEEFAVVASTAAMRYRSEAQLAVATERELICSAIPRRLWPWYWKYAPIW